MNKMYEILDGSRSKIKSLNVKNSSLWRRLIPVRILIWVAYVVIPIVIYSKYHDSASLKDVGTCIYFLFLYILGYSIIPILFYYIVLTRCVNWGIMKKMYETLCFMRIEFIILIIRIINRTSQHMTSGRYIIIR